MMKNLLRLFFLLVLGDSAAQISTTDFVKKYDEYNAVWQEKKLHLIFNQDKFSPGDTVYFKAYFLSEDLSKVPGNQLIELHLVDASGNSVLNIRFATTDGVGNNQFIIPQKLPQGFYLVTAYSSWMLNFDPVVFFQKRITVVERNRISLQKKQNLQVAVEGGRLISGLKTKATISAEANSVVQITDASGVSVGHTLTDSTGFGSINFTPGDKNSYFVQQIGNEDRSLLPPVQREGLGLSLITSEDSSTKFLVTATPGNQNNEFIAIVSSRGKACFAVSFRTEAAGVEVTVPMSRLSEGIAHLSILDASGHLFASRDFYVRGNVQTNANIKIAKETFRSREKVKLVVSLTDDAGQPLEGEFSIKAIVGDLLESPAQNTFADELLIQPYLKERHSVVRTDPNWIFKLDDYLMLNSHDISWSKIIAEKMARPTYGLSNFVQMKGHVSLIDTNSGKLPDFLDILFYLQYNRIHYQTSVEKGEVWLAIPSVFGEDELLYQAETFYYVNDQQHGEEIRNIKIDWENALPKFQAAPAFMATEQLDPYASFAAKSRMINQSYGFYSSKVATQPKSSSKELVEADVNINVQEYTLFPTMADLIKEVIPYLQHRKIGHRDRVLASLNEDLALQSTGDPLYIIDGTATKNTDFFLSLKPSELLNVKVVINSQKLKPLGMLGKNGIVIVNTKKGNTREPVDPSRLIQGLSRPVDFKNHAYANESVNHTPDFRSTVLWSPSVKTNVKGEAEVEFFTSDNLGIITVRIDGLTSHNTPFSKEVQLSVVNDLKK